jgi:putative hydrolase of the HAD superfamily
VERPSCVVFDLDDTLFLERDYARSGFAAVDRWMHERLGIAGFGARAWGAFETGTRGTIFDEALRAAGLDPEPGLVSTLVDVYRHHQPDIAMLPDAAAALRALADRDVVLAVVTDGPLASQHAKARAMSAHEWAAVVVFTEELGLAKPDPASFARVEQLVERAGHECAYVADNPIKDFRGPRQRGWTTVRVRRPGSLHFGVPNGPDVDLEVADLTELAGPLAPLAG